MQDFDPAAELSKYPRHFTFGVLAQAIQLAYAVADSHPQAKELAEFVKNEALEQVAERDAVKGLIHKAAASLDEGDFDTDDEPMVSTGQDDGFYAYVCMWVPQPDRSDDGDDSSDED